MDSLTVFLLAPPVIGVIFVVAHNPPMEVAFLPDCTLFDWRQFAPNVVEFIVVAFQQALQKLYVHCDTLDAGHAVLAVLAWAFLHVGLFGLCCRCFAGEKGDQVGLSVMEFSGCDDVVGCDRCTALWAIRNTVRNFDIGGVRVTLWASDVGFHSVLRGCRGRVSPPLSLLFQGDSPG